ncbi:MAG TPA: PqqD family protein [Solirubrobacteraceae bacterium]|jgi:predicted anti-sigma-YlaC factor YlaD
MSEETLRLRADRVEWRAVGEEVVALDVAESMYLAVGPVGAAMWPHLAEGTDLERLVEVVTAGFEVDAETARRDIRAFIEDLRERDLLER